jgi:hypothetical protein
MGDQVDAHTAKLLLARRIRSARKNPDQTPEEQAEMENDIDEFNRLGAEVPETAAPQVDNIAMLHGVHVLVTSDEAPDGQTWTMSLDGDACRALVDSDELTACTDRQTIQAAGSLLTMDTVPTAARVGEAKQRQMAELATEPASSPAVTLGDGNVDDQEEAEEPGAEDGNGGELWTMVRLNRTADFVGSDDKVLLTALGWKRNQATEAWEAKLGRKTETLDAQGQAIMIQTMGALGTNPPKSSATFTDDEVTEQHREGWIAFMKAAEASPVDYRAPGRQDLKQSLADNDSCHMVLPPTLMEAVRAILPQLESAADRLLKQEQAARAERGSGAPGRDKARSTATTRPSIPTRRYEAPIAATNVETTVQEATLPEIHIAFHYPKEDNHFITLRQEQWPSHNEIYAFLVTFLVGLGHPNQLRAARPNRQIQAYTVTCRTADATAALQHEIQNGMVTFEADGQEGQPKDRIYVTPIVFRTMQQIKINMLDGKAGCMDDNDYLDTAVESAFLQKGFKVTAKLVQRVYKEILDPESGQVHAVFDWNGRTEMIFEAMGTMTSTIAKTMVRDRRRLVTTRRRRCR